MQKTTLKVASQFALILLGLLIASFALQLSIYSAQDYPLLSGYIIPSYAFNYGYALMTFIILLIAHKKKSNQIGFLYMGMSLLKLIIFMVGFKRLFMQDGDMDNFETLGFLIPYILCLFSETIYLVRLLKVNQEKK